MLGFIEIKQLTQYTGYRPEKRAKTDHNFQEETKFEVNFSIILYMYLYY